MKPELDEAERGAAPIELPAHGLDLRTTAAPVAWGKGRWPTVDWIDGELYWLLAGECEPRLIRVRQERPESLLISGFATVAEAEAWAARSLGWRTTVPAIDEPVVARLLNDAPGLRPYASGTLAHAVVTTIIGQSISVQAAAITERRVFSLYSSGVEAGGRTFYPSPRVEELAETSPARLRETGLTWRRAEAIAAIAKLAVAGQLPSDDEARSDPDGIVARLRELPLVGPWTAASALLWGLAIDDAHPTRDVALLRAARLAYERPEMNLRELDVLAEAWRPSRGWAARALWLMLLGPAPDRACSRSS